jgi:hypothetical protein
VFGGSVALASYHQQPHDAALPRALTEQSPCPGGRRVRALNLAIPGGQQPQQLLVLTQNRHLLDGVVTFDGVNEVVVPSCYNKDHVLRFSLPPVLRMLFGQAMNEEQIGASMIVERTTFSLAPRLAATAARAVLCTRSGLPREPGGGRGIVWADQFRSIFGTPAASRPPWRSRGQQRPMTPRSWVTSVAHRASSRSSSSRSRSRQAVDEQRTRGLDAQRDIVATAPQATPERSSTAELSAAVARRSVSKVCSRGARNRFTRTWFTSRIGLGDRRGSTGGTDRPHVAGVFHDRTSYQSG